MQTYTLTPDNKIDSHIVSSVGIGFLKDVEAYDHVRKPEEPSWPLNQVAKEFKDQKATIKRVIKEKREKIADLVRIENNIKNVFYKSYNGSDREFMEWNYQMSHVKMPRARIEASILRLEKILSYMQRGDGGKFDVSKAKERPIADFVEFDRSGFAKSIWATHDKTPSMKYYKKENRVHCFSSGEDEDVIGVVMHLNSCTFIEAVKIILQ